MMPFELQRDSKVEDVRNLGSTVGLSVNLTQGEREW